jgi:hypothetical protein
LLASGGLLLGEPAPNRRPKLYGLFLPVQIDQLATGLEYFRGICQDLDWLIKIMQDDTEEGEVGTSLTEYRILPPANSQLQSGYAGYKDMTFYSAPAIP